MRSDSAGSAFVAMPRGLKVYGLARAVAELVEEGAPAFEATLPILSQLLKAEMAEHEVRSIVYHTKTARFPAYKDLASFDFAASEVNEAMVRQLHRGGVPSGQALVRWSIQEVRRIAVRLAQRNIRPNHVIA